MNRAPQSPAQTISIESDAVAAGDLNNDGHPDIAGAGAGEQSLTILLGDGEGEFIVSGSAPAGENPAGLALADLDEDGDIDIVIANHDTNYLTILLGDGSGAFQPAPNSPSIIEVQPHPHAVRAADLDADGHVDLVVDHRDAEGLLILRGNGDGTFASPGDIVEVGGDPYLGMWLGDINGDGMLDLVTPNPGEAGVRINASDEQIVFNQADPVPADAPFAVALGDINSDGNLDLIAGSDEGSPLVQLFAGDGQGGFEETGDSPIRFAPGGKNIVVGDFNGDGIDDAAVSCYQSPDVLVLFGGRSSIRTTHLAGGEHPWSMAVADFNGDGVDDLVIADDLANQVTVYVSIDQ